MALPAHSGPRPLIQFRNHFSQTVRLLGRSDQPVVLPCIPPPWLYSLIMALAASMKLSVSLQLLDLRQSVGLLGRVISSSQDLYLYTNTEKRTHNTNTKHPCQEWDSNPRFRRPRERRQFLVYNTQQYWTALLSFLDMLRTPIPTFPLKISVNFNFWIWLLTRFQLLYIAILTSKETSAPNKDVFLLLVSK
jgi:hypothetical protein